jgi:hypothetical protein
MRSSYSLLLLGLTAPLPALETKPWLGDVYEFNFQGVYSFSRFHKVQGASRQLKHPFHNQDVLLDLGFTLSSTFDLQAEGEFGQTSQTGWNFRSAALQGRWRLLDDIAGDPITLTLGLIFRGASPHFLHDISTPYAAPCNLELTCALGKEWSSVGVWTMRTYGLLSLGQGSRGFPWTRELAVWELNLNDTHRWTLFGEGYVGFGNRQHVNVRHFDGWGHFQHQSIDLGLSYGYKFGLYGVLTGSYARRVFAHNFPEHVNFFILSYQLPFSLL